MVAGRKEGLHPSVRTSHRPRRPGGGSPRWRLLMGGSGDGCFGEDERVDLVVGRVCPADRHRGVGAAHEEEGCVAGGHASTEGDGDDLVGEIRGDVGRRGVEPAFAEVGADVQTAGVGQLLAELGVIVWGFGVPDAVDGVAQVVLVHERASSV